MTERLGVCELRTSPHPMRRWVCINWRPIQEDEVSEIKVGDRVTGTFAGKAEVRALDGEWVGLLGDNGNRWWSRAQDCSPIPDTVLVELPRWAVVQGSMLCAGPDFHGTISLACRAALETDRR